MIAVKWYHCVLATSSALSTCKSLAMAAYLNSFSAFALQKLTQKKKYKTSE
uniref:Uncharacterized protein n=1 Tax=Rhizophora mucronata TaxID=61149 RepID=A0A2P2NL13_RHIMU